MLVTAERYDSGQHFGVHTSMAALGFLASVATQQMAL
jgi:hypothetical protein